MKKVAKFSLFFFTLCVQKALNTSELGIVWIVSRENKKGMEIMENFISNMKLPALRLFQVVIKVVN